MKKNSKRGVDKLIKEFEMINKESFEMARAIHKQSVLRPQAAEKASLLKKRLLDIAEELERVSPAVHKQWFHQISESLLDLYFMEGDSGTTSLRLGDIIKWG